MRPRPHEESSMASSGRRVATSIPVGIRAMTDEDVERIDHIVGDPAATRWRRGARRHQSMWRESQGWARGTQSLGKNRGTRTIASRILNISPTDGRNFLNDATRRAVSFRLDNPQHL